MSDPDIGELVRNLERLRRSVDNFVAEVRADYQRKELYEAKHAQLVDDVAEIQTGRRDEATQRRQFTLWLIGLTTTLMVTIGLSLLNFISSRGGLH